MALNKEFAARRLHSLLGIIPIGLFLMQHFVINHFATRSAEAFNGAAHFMENLPFRIFLEMFLIYIPILFHGIYGLFIVFQGKANAKRFGYFRNWMYIFQRITGVFLLVFITWHVWDTWVQAQFFGADVNYQMMADIVANPWMLAFYIVGILAATFHFSNGLWSFLVTWGITVTPKAQLAATYFTLVVFVAMSVIGLRAIFAFV
ncbi:succinate dehydrogenase subunit C [Marinococcus luteus]|uniref:Succinate dehydrogenase subunit C n=1 Tax=Marinococcus luteus TaxID=1122204 RepID=A0A1H2VK30_9BACI|nr:succinate dehydrogenase cytochrome b558 subunit [Marinococcus luteus]SDW68686.1 succinate dehydrogenase subunit C [Marinococcus luteus]